MVGNLRNQLTHRAGALVALGAALVAVALWYWWSASGGEGAHRTFNGSSRDLKQTVIVPTLDTPIPEGKTAIWCATMPMCWNQLCTDVVKGPLVIRGAEELSQRLNNAAQTQVDLPPESYYVAAGLTGDGIAEKIRRDMAAKFSSVAPPDFGLAAKGMAVAFSYLQTSIRYTHPYRDHKLDFRSGTEPAQSVQGFGLDREDDSKYFPVREQTEILFANPGKENDWTATEFVIDLCKNSMPNQVIVARLARKGNLTETLADVEAKMQNYAAAAHRERPHPLHFNDTLLVPKMHWRIDHRFTELEGPDKPFVNPALQGAYLIQARQVIAFDLDKSGVQLRSENDWIVGSSPQTYEFRGPFLLYLKKRDGKQPFFAMWVDNAELLRRR